MIRFVEYDENGDIFHICEVHTAEGADAPPAIVEPLEEPSDPTERAKGRADRQARRAARKARIDALIEEREQATISQLQAEAAKPGKRLIVLPKGAPEPRVNEHKVENGKIRALTQTEKDARRAAREAQNPPVPTP